MNYGKTLYNISVFYFKLKDFKKSLEYQLEQKKIYFKIFGKNHHLFVEVLSSLAATYFYLKDYNKSLEYFRKAKYYKKKIFGDTHPSYIKLL